MLHRLRWFHLRRKLVLEGRELAHGIRPAIMQKRSIPTSRASLYRVAWLVAAGLGKASNHVAKVSVNPSRPDQPIVNLRGEVGPAAAILPTRKPGPPIVRATVGDEVETAAGGDPLTGFALPRGDAIAVDRRGLLRLHARSVRVASRIGVSYLLCDARLPTNPNDANELSKNISRC